MEIESTTVTDPPTADQWSSAGQVQCREYDSDSNTFEDDQPVAKIKPEVELKEETGGFVYKADTQGHLKLVCSNVNIPSSNSESCETSSNEIPSSSQFNGTSLQLKSEYVQEKILVTQNEHITKNSIESEISLESPVDTARYTNSFASYGPHSVMNYPTEHETFQVPPNDYPDLTIQWTRLKGLPDGMNMFFKKHFDDAETYQSSPPKPTDISRSSSPSQLSDNSSQDICSKSDQALLLPNNLPHITYKRCEKTASLSEFSCSHTEVGIQKRDNRKKEVASNKSGDLSEAEKKRLYRKKIKDTNPELWQIIKQRDAAQKRQKRAQRQMIAREMQMQLELESSSSESVQSLYLDALKERYPDVWEQLLHTVPEVRNRIDHKSRGAKSVSAYKDIIEAEKKRLYREKIKREKPEMWERQKARDAQRRSLQRLMKNPKRMYNGDPVKQERSEPDPFSTDKELTYLQNLEIDQTHFTSDQNVDCHLIPLQPVSVTETNYSNERVEPLASSSQPDVASMSEEVKYHRANIKIEDNPSSTQSKILWFWNDTPDIFRNRKSIPVSPSNMNVEKSQEMKHLSDSAIKCELSDESHTKETGKKRRRNKGDKE